MRVYQAGTKIMCPACEHRHLLQGKTLGEKNDKGQTVTAVPLQCPACGKVNKQIMILRGMATTDKADRIQSTMRYEPEVYKFINDLANETGLSIADLVNEMLAIYMNDRKGITNEIVERLQGRQAE